MSSVITRRPTGTPAGGQFAPAQHGEPALVLSRTEFDTAFESAHGQELLTRLQALPPVPLRDAVTASKYPDLLRESYGCYFANGQTDADRATGNDSLRQALSGLPVDRRDEYVTLIGFAVHTEMKHYENPEYLASSDHQYEQLIDFAAYPEFEEEPFEATIDNREAWALLADQAAAAALTEAAYLAPMRHAA